MNTRARKRQESRVLAVLVAAGVAAAAFAPSVMGQSGLGAGNRLNKNLGKNTSGPSSGPGASIPRPNIASQARLNNAIVTGNVAGGRQFRGSVGYSGALDFRGRTASDDLFAFQRDAFASGLATQGVRGIGGLQEQLSLQTNILPSTLAGDVVLKRETSGTGGSELQTRSGATPAINPSTFRPGGLRSLSKFTTDAANDAAVFASRGTARGEPAAGGIGASALRGVYQLPTPARDTNRGTTVVGAMPPSLTTSPPLAPRPGATDSQRVSELAEPAPEGGKIENESTYQRLLKQIEEGRRGDARPAPVTEPKEEPPAAPASTWVRPPEPKAEPLAPGAMPLPGEQPAGAPGVPGAPGAPGEPGAGGVEEDEADLSFEERLSRLRERLMTMDPTRPDKAKWPDDMDAESREEEDEAHATIAREAADLFGGDRPLVARFTDPAKDPGAFDRHMMSGQRALAADKWFNAEEAFTRAIVARRDEPLASVGRMHAQLGAGMFLSAAINARAILRERPELAAVKYGSELLPRAERLDAVLASLREASDRQDSYGRDAGLLLAYLGNQTGSLEDVRRGLDAVERIEQRLEMAPDPLIDALRAVWLPGAR